MMPFGKCTVTVEKDVFGFESVVVEALIAS